MSDSEPPVEETRLAPLQLTTTFRTSPQLSWTDFRGTHALRVNERMLIGTAAGAGVLIQNPTVSRVHAAIDPRDNGLWIRDLGSRNGTFVQGLQVIEARIPDGARVRVGGVELVVTYDPEAKQPIEVWPQDTFGRLVGPSPAMRELFARLSRVAPMDASVLIHGETGTGKELVARAIHDASPRADRPFVVVDCASLPENLLDAELFGHARGAFTGAVGSRVGAMEAADGGTVFLDEIGELPVSMQPKLLRVLESRTIRRVGDTAHRSIDVRFISATHRDLLGMVGAGEFREDLFFRLAVLPIEVPPLRERRADIGRLVNHFLDLAGVSGPADPELIEELTARPWRGNVRELRNFVERARSLGAKEALAMSLPSKPSPAPAAAATATAPPASAPPELPVRNFSETGFTGAYKDFREAWIELGEKEYMRRLLARHERNVAAAAREAGVDRTYIYRLIRRHDL